MYSISWSRLMDWLLPHPVRNSLMREWLLVLITPLIAVHSAFIAYQRRVFYAVKATGQVTKLRAYLNYLFDFLLNRIEIFDVSAGDYIYMYQEYENKPLYLPAFLSGASYSFVVLIPTEYKNRELQIRAIIDSYKLPTKKYYIIWT